MAAPKFEYHPGLPGRAVGIRATVLVGGVELETNEVEITLAAEESAASDDAPSDLESAPGLRSASVNSSRSVRSASIHTLSSRFERSGSASQLNPFQPLAIASPVRSTIALASKADVARAAHSAWSKSAEPTTDAALNTPNSVTPEGPNPESVEWDTLASPLESDNCPVPGSKAESMGTVNGFVCYISASGSLGTLGVQQSYTLTTLFTREGIYHARSIAKQAYVPPDFLNLAHTWSVGCIPENTKGALAADYYNDLSSLSMTYSLFIYSQGVTFFMAPEGPTRAIQFDTGVTVSASAFGLGFPFNLGLAIQTDSDSIGPYFVQSWPSGCTPGPTQDNLWEFAKAANSSSGPSPSPLAKMIRNGLTPLFKVLAATGVGGAGHHVPAASNADLFADQLSHSDTTPDESAADTTIDGLVRDSLDDLGAAGDDAASILGAASAVQQRAAATLPSRLELVAVLDKAKAAVYAIDELSTLARQSAEEKFVASELVDIPVLSGESATFSVTTEEVADLIGRPVADVVNARVLVNAGPDIVDAEFFLGEQGLDLTITPEDGDLLVRIDIDLSTAQGTFPSDVSSWLVRPAMRVITVKAGDPAYALLTAPDDIASGGAASLNVQVVDANGKVVDANIGAVFTDAEGNQIANVDGENGSGMAQYVPEPSSPDILDIQRTDLTVDGESLPGIEIHGTGFSLDAELRMDGQLLIAGEDYAVKSSTRILSVAVDSANDHEYQVVNPPGINSDTFTLPAL